MSLPVVVAEQKEPSGEDAEFAIFRAETGFITDTAKRALEFWWSSEARQHIGFSSFRRRASLGNWVQRREEYWREISRQVVLVRAGRLAAQQMDEMEKLDKVYADLVEQVSQAKCRSKEGGIAALVALDKRLEEKRDQVLDRLKLTEEEQARNGRQDHFTEEEWRAIAAAVLRVRMQTQGAPAFAESKRDSAT